MPSGLGSTLVQAISSGDIATAIHGHCLFGPPQSNPFSSFPAEGLEDDILLLVPHSPLDYIWISQDNTEALLDLSSAHTLLSLAES